MNEDLKAEIEHDLRMKLKEIILTENRADKRDVIEVLRGILNTSEYEDLY